MTITVLAENHVRQPGLGSEHGLSLLIRWQGQSILFDMRQGDLFARNADALGEDLSQVDWAVVSHGHYDHGGGLGTFLDRNATAPVYISRYAFQPHFNAQGKYIGLDRALFRNPRLVFTTGDRDICPGAVLYAPRKEERQTPLDTAGLTAEVRGVLQPEDFRHEQYLLLEEEGKRVLFSGCSHHGALEILRWFRPDVLVGGFHLMRRALDPALLALARELDATGTVCYTCHCTGLEQYRYMRPAMPRVGYLSTGMSVEI